MSAARDKRPRGQADAALRALRGLLEACDARAAIVSWTDRPWRSVTFSGRKVSAVLDFPGAAAVATGEAFISLAGAFDPELRDCRVVDCSTIWRCYHAAGGENPEPRLTCGIELLLLDLEGDCR